MDWHVRLEAAGETGLLDTVNSLMVELRRDFGSWIRQHYPRWVRGKEKGPLLSVDVVRELLVPLLGPNPVFFVVLDCMRLDQWRVIAPTPGPLFRDRGTPPLLHPSYGHALCPERLVQREVSPTRSPGSGLGGGTTPTMKGA